jgi:hypothetical protein
VARVDRVVDRGVRRLAGGNSQTRSKTAFNLSQYRDFVNSFYRSFVIKRNLSLVHGQQTWKGEERKHDNVLSRLPIFTIYCFPVFV